MQPQEQLVLDGSTPDPTGAADERDPLADRLQPGAGRPVPDPPHDREFRGPRGPHAGGAARGRTPSILNWAITGWKRLRARGHFVQPPSGQPLVDELTELSSRITTFLADACETDPQYQEAIPHVYLAWCHWCEAQGESNPGSTPRSPRNCGRSSPAYPATKPPGFTTNPSNSSPGCGSPPRTATWSATRGTRHSPSPSEPGCPHQPCHPKALALPPEAGKRARVPPRLR